MKIYIASRYSRREEMEKVAERLEALGHEVTARWVYGNEEGKTREAIACMDYEDVIRAECCLSFTQPHGSYNPAGGRHTEFGMAYHANLWCCLVGEREQVFHWLPKVEQFNTLDDFLIRIA